jgi:hypothetical protein
MVMLPVTAEVMLSLATRPARGFTATAVVVKAA